MYKNSPVVIVAAMSKGHKAIGKENGLLWHIPEDMKRFKKLTVGHPVIMGRKTFESIVEIVGGPLPNRPNIVITRNTDFKYDGVEVVTSLEDGLEKAVAHNPNEIHIGGGSEIYKIAMPYVDKLMLTLVNDEPEGDAFFPEFENDFEVSEKHGVETHNNLEYEWVDFVRK